MLSCLAPQVAVSQVKGRAVPWRSQETSQRSQHGGWAPPAPLPSSPRCTGGEGSSKGPRDPPNSGAAVRALTRPRPHAGSATLAQVSRDLYLLYRSHRRRRTQEFHFLSLV